MFVYYPPYDLTTQTAWAAVLESPNQGLNLSGIGLISGWKCHATDITITINDGEHLTVAMHQERADLIEICGSARHGFITQINWAWSTISDGKHTVVAYDEGVEFDRAKFTVGTLGEEFVKGAERQTVIEDFPSPDEYTVMEWNESTQHFEVLSVLGGEQRETEVQYDSTFWTNLEDLIAKFSHVYHAKYDPTFWTNLEDLIETWKEELSCEEGTECGSMADR